MPTMLNRRLKNLLVALLVLHLALPPVALAQGANDLPDIGSPASSALSLDRSPCNAGCSRR